MSVVVPVRDRRALLRDLLDALARQRFDDFEVVVVDDASSDGSADEAAVDRGIAVRVLRLERAAGAVAARTAGVQAATGEVLAFTDSDCVPSPGWLAGLLAALDAGADVAQGLTRPTGPVGPRERSVWADREDGLYATCNVAYRRAAFEGAGGFAEDGAARLGFRPGRRARGLGFGEDALLGWRVRRSGGTSVFVPGAVVEHQVLREGLRSALGRAWQAGAFPALVAELPELRTTLLHRRYLLGRRAQLALLGAVVAAAARRPLAAALLAGWWGRAHVHRVDRSDPRWPVHLAALLAREVVTEAALVAGSARTRTPVF